MSVKHKISGFFTAVVLAIVSFFVIFFFLPDFSEKYLGTSFQSDKLAKKTVAEKVSDSAKETLSTVTDRLGEFFGK